MKILDLLHRYITIEYNENQEIKPGFICVRQPLVFRDRLLLTFDAQ